MDLGILDYIMRRKTAKAKNKCVYENCEKSFTCFFYRKLCGN